jgi:hypothetical protein
MAIDTSEVYIDFDIVRSNSCKSLKVWDESHWPTSQDEGAYIEITTPGAIKPVNHVFEKGRVNIFNVVNLNLSDNTDYSSLGNLPDGMYTVTVLRCEGDPKAVTKYFLQDCILRCQVAKKLISVDLLCNPCRRELLEEIQDVFLFIEGAQAQTDRCNVLKAMEYYQRASLILSRISDTKNCKC